MKPTKTPSAKKPAPTKAGPHKAAPKKAAPRKSTPGLASHVRQFFALFAVFFARETWVRAGVELRMAVRAPGAAFTRLRKAIHWPRFGKALVSDALTAAVIFGILHWMLQQYFQYDGSRQQGTLSTMVDGTKWIALGSLVLAAVGLLLWGVQAVLSRVARSPRA